VQGPTSGTALIDTLIDGVRIGDNLVFLGDTTAPLDLLVDRFVTAARGEVPVVVVNVAGPWSGPVPDGTAVLDWSAVRTGKPSRLPGSLPPDATFEDAVAALRVADERAGEGAGFVFDRLSAVQEVWGRAAALELFLSTCPRLYRRRSLAVWPVEGAQHRPTFLRRLTEITQVVIELADDDGQLQMTVRKADGRDPAVVGRSVHAEVVDSDLEATEPPTTSRERLGTLVRDQRLARSLSQAEVARRIGITPSALSQIERGVRGPSGDTLVALWEVLGVPFGPAAARDHGYRVARRSGRERARLQEGLTGECIVDDPATGELWRVDAAPGASGDRPPFAVKAPEVATVVRGILDLQVGGRTETLHEGDALVAVAATITGWANPGGSPTEVIWTIYPTAGSP
jgi:transcriptional regulator with XRE-family HTH domain